MITDKSVTRQGAATGLFVREPMDQCKFAQSIFDAVNLDGFSWKNTYFDSQINSQVGGICAQIPSAMPSDN